MLEPKFHYINHENGKVQESFFSEDYLEPPIAERMMMDVIVPETETKVIREIKQVPYSEIGKYYKVKYSIKQILG